MNTDIFEEIDALYADYVKIWEDVCNIESPTDFKAGVDEVCDFFVRKAKELGFDVDVFYHDVAGNAATITMNADSGKAPICLSGHMDTVYPVGSFGKPAVRLDDKYIYGPGVVDCKGGIVVALLAMHALKNVGFTARPVKLILQSDEENGSRSSAKQTVDYICRQAAGAVAFINLEGHRLNSGEACVKRKGILNLEFTVEGKEGHASQCATIGANAVVEAAHKIIELDKFKDEDAITCCSSVISGGSAPNTIPGRCTFITNVRFATKAEEEFILKYAKELADKTFVDGCKTSLTVRSSRPAMELTAQNKALLERMNDIFVGNGMTALKAATRLGGSDAAYTTSAGIPTVDALGAEGAKIHSPDEYGVLNSLLVMAKRLAVVCKEI